MRNLVQSTDYTYDNLNRIRNSVAVSPVDNNLRAGGNTWDNSEIVGSVIGGSFQNGLATTYTYDAGGNISDLTRTDMTGNFHYNYEALTINGLGSKNKLEYISDLANSNLRADDIDNQASSNYSYDLNGRLVSDVHDNVTLIKWSKSDKVLEVHKTKNTPTGIIDEVLTIKYNALDQKVSQSTSRNDSIVTEYFVYDPSGNVLTSYGDTIFTTNGNHRFSLHQLTIYGSSRIGLIEVDSLLWKDGSSNIATVLGAPVYSQKLGLKRYELSNHLGNVQTVVSDRKSVDSHSGGQITSWKADVISVTDYYPFGMKITERSWNRLVSGVEPYRFGFNGKDFFSDWNRQDYGFRIYDPRKCRFESVDPLHGEYPELTTYQFASNNPVWGIDLDGAEIQIRIWSPEISRKVWAIWNSTKDKKDASKKLLTFLTVANALQGWDSQWAVDRFGVRPVQVVPCNCSNDVKDGVNVVLSAFEIDKNNPNRKWDSNYPNVITTETILIRKEEYKSALNDFVNSTEFKMLKILISTGAILTKGTQVGLVLGGVDIMMDGTKWIDMAIRYQNDEDYRNSGEFEFELAQEIIGKVAGDGGEFAGVLTDLAKSFIKFKSSKLFEPNNDNDKSPILIESRNKDGK